MNLLNSILILLTAWLEFILESSYGGARHLFGAQIDLIPPLIVYAALRSSIVTMAILAVVGGCAFDSLSLNPLELQYQPR